MTYLLDGVVILIFLLAIWLGYRRGFIKSVAGIVAFIAAFAVATMLCASVAVWTYDTVVEPSLTDTVEQQLTAAGASTADRLDTAYQALPTVVRNLLAQTGVADADGLALSADVTADSRNILRMLRTDSQ